MFRKRSHAKHCFYSVFFDELEKPPDESKICIRITGATGSNVPQTGKEVEMLCSIIYCWPSLFLFVWYLQTRKKTWTTIWNICMGEKQQDKMFIIHVSIT